MAAILKSGGLQHACSLGNIEISSKTGNCHLSSRSYDSEDENMGRKKTRPNGSALYPKASVYSKVDIQEQYCLSERQLSTIERPRRDGFFGCWSGRSTPQSILGVCVGRRHPSDEHLADYAPFYKYPRYPRATNGSHGIIQNEDDLESSYFRRRPTSFLCSSDPKRFTWMVADDEAVRLEGPRSVRPDGIDDTNRGPYVVGIYPPSSYLSQSSEHLAGVYRCPAHVGLPSVLPSTQPIAATDGVSIGPSRTKHVSFARSHTLTSFDEMSVGRSVSRLSTTKSQERLIGGKKASSSPEHSLQQRIHSHQLHHHHHHQLQQQQQQQLFQPNILPLTSLPQTHPLNQQQQFHPEVIMIEKMKRGSMKTQATQTDVYLARKLSMSSHLSLSPRTVHRVRTVSNGAQANGVSNGRKLTKSLSEAMGARKGNLNGESVVPSKNISSEYQHHEPIYRTQSEEPPRSPYEINELAHSKSVFTHLDGQSRASSRQSDLETSKSDVYSTTDHALRHSRNLSQDSATTYRSVDFSASKASQESVSMMFTHENMVMAKHANHTGCIEFMESATHPSYESNSLPRRKCAYHVEEYQTNSLPRKDVNQHFREMFESSDDTERTNFNLNRFRAHGTFSLESSMGSNQNLVETIKRRYSCGVQETMRHLNQADLEDLQALVRRNSTSNFFHMHSQQDEEDEEEDSDSEEYCSTCDSESDSKQEKEIFIDFKPRISPVPSPRSRRKRLQKTMSEGEILFDKRRELINDEIPLTSTSEEDLKTKENLSSSYLYSNIPIKDEGVCVKSNLLKLPTDRDANVKHRREAFRKRSISLEESTVDDGDNQANKPIKSSPPSPGIDDKADKNISTFPSSDSLANDLTRDHSDGIWNESQATVLQIEPSASDSGTSLLTPTTKRKNLLLQHQQRSSMDTEALEMEDHFYDQSVAQPNLAAPSTLKIGGTNKPGVQKTTHKSPDSTGSATTPISPSLASNIIMPSITVIPSHSIETEEYESSTLHRKQKVKATTARTDLRRKSAEPIVHIYSNIKPELGKFAPISKSSSDQQPFLHHSDSTKTNATDISECSTNTEDYMTCTEASKRGTKQPSASSSSTTQVPVATQSSQTLTQDGSSFESASSIYSLARVDAICEDGSMTTIEDTLPLPPAPSTKPSPSHSISSSSSGSYCMFGGKKPIKVPASPRSSIAKPMTAAIKPRSESVSDDEKSEKRYSSSGYYESPQDDEPSRPRRLRDWNEDERRRRKEKMRLDIEKENMKSLTSPSKKPIPAFKQISPDDRTALHILDGTNQNKTKRIRPKTRRSPRTRNSNEDPITRKIKTSIVISPERSASEILETGISPSKYPTHVSPSAEGSTKKCLGPSPEKRLKALSTESLRSVSPGSDSVFYSEADVHCHHCGKEVEIITAMEGPEESLVAQDERRPNIVKPPADFADSPDGIRTPHHTTRLYKKLDKRFRSEERHGDRKHFRNRQESTRAKSEERGKDEANKEEKGRSLRPAGSSPCVVVDGSFNVRDQVADPEHGIYHGFYRLGMWICIADRDVWRRHDFGLHDERTRDIGDRRPSTESEKDFRKKYQAITHRLVHRKSCVEMYRRQTSDSFSKLVSPPSRNESLRRQLEEILKQMLLVWAKEGIALNSVSCLKSGTDKTVVVRRESGEFGFRIHGSKPVVVSAIEPETPAETSGLEVGDIVLSVNGVSVIDKSHSEVVKIAHAGSDVLELEVARTIGMLTNETTEASSPSLYSGYLWRQGCHHGTPASNQKWVRRWFCLRPDHCLYYYKTDQDTQPVGAVLLTNHTVENCSGDIGRPFAFRISSNESLPLYLAADTEEAANRWVAITSHAAKQTDPWLEISTRNLRLPPNGVPRPDCFGYLMKLGNRWRAWSKRYCVLKDACLYFYHDGNSKSAFGMACLQGYRVQPSNNTAGKKFAFEITPPEPKLRHYCFSTDSDMDKKRWVAALEYSIDRWMKAA